MNTETKIIRKEIIQLTCEFLETWIHQILYQWHLYPRGIFETKKKFQVAVHVATFPSVHDYIASFIHACHSLLEKGELRKVAIVIIEDDDRPIEKVVFEVLPSFEKDDTMDHILDSVSVYTLADLEQHLRSCLLQLKSHPTQAIENRTFQLSIEKEESGPPTDNHSLEWVPSDLHYQWRNLTPLKSQHMDIFRFNTFIMEASRKGKEKCL